jgi:exopolyphosphatase/guanosine-5'-triphosphate,3'-diphosphate pyrophosphatase
MGIRNGGRRESDRELTIERRLLRSTEIVNAIIELGEAHRFETNHALQVTRLALRLFDDLQPLHGMGNTERIWLRAAAMLHDVGKVEKPKDHHKVAQEIIVRASELPFRAEERIVIGLVARYHRGSLPKDDHKYYRDLDHDGRRYVRRLASLLRLADGLDKGHSDLVEGLHCHIRRRRVLIGLAGRRVPNIGSALNKADLFELVFRKKAVFRVAVAPRRRGSPLDLDTKPAYADMN